MFERFTNRARQMVVGAQQEARNLHHGWIGTEHLLLGLVTEPRGMGAQLLASMGATEDRVRDRLGHYLPPGHEEYGSAGHIPFTPRAKKVLELGLREAIQLGHDRIGTEHVLLALIREEDGLAGQALRDLGVRYEAAREQVIARDPRQAAPASPSEIESLRAEVARLRDLLRRHDIDPGEDSSASTP